MLWEINGKYPDKELSVGELIEELQKYPPNSKLGYYSVNAHLRGDPVWITPILGVELCRDGKTISIIGDFS